VIISIFQTNLSAARLEVKDFYDLSTKKKELAISLIDTKNKQLFLKNNMVPIGSSVLTGSGDLEKTGIKGILHAASGSMSKHSGVYRPSLKGVELSVMNSLKLAQLKGYKSVAVPFVGGGIFLNSIGVSKLILAKSILGVSLREANKLKLTIVAYTNDDYEIFKKAIKELKAENSKSLKIIRGSITKFSDHQSQLIINAANTELIFGGGLSGHIGSKTNKYGQINSDCKFLIRKILAK
jgi:O-acetyl-ADP-ribose deacetylase (regulator of RNase III)